MLETKAEEFHGGYFQKQYVIFRAYRENQKGTSRVISINDGEKEHWEVCPCGAKWKSRKKEYVAIVQSRPHIICSTCALSAGEVHVLHVDVNEPGPWYEKGGK